MFSHARHSGNLPIRDFRNVQDFNASVVWATTGDRRVQEESPATLTFQFRAEHPWYSRAWNTEETQSRLQGQSVWRKNTFVGCRRVGARRCWVHFSGLWWGKLGRRVELLSASKSSFLLFLPRMFQTVHLFKFEFQKPRERHGFVSMVLRAP